MTTETLSLKVSPELESQVRKFAADSDLTLSAGMVVLIRRALEEGGAKRLKRDLKDEGYQAGLRRGLHDARVAIREAMAKLWSGE